MNTARLLHIADMLERRNLPTGWVFSMNTLASDLSDEADLAFGPSDTTPQVYDCGTACCIAGLAAIVYAPEAKEPEDLIDRLNDSADDWAERELGLDHDKARDLFYPTLQDDDPQKSRWSFITPERAARVIRHLAATGVVDWSIQ